MSLHGRFLLSHRLAAGFGLVLALLLLVTAFAFQRLTLMERTLEEMVEVHEHRIAAAQAMMDAVNEVSVATLGFALTTEPDDVKGQIGDLQLALKAYARSRQQFFGDGTVAQQVAGSFTDAERSALTITSSVESMARSGANVSSGLVALDPREAQAKWLRSISALIMQETAASADAFARARASARFARILLVVLSAIALFAGLAAAWSICRSVTEPLAVAIAHARRIARGDLAGEISSGGSDEMGDLLRVLSQMQSGLHAMVQRTRLSIDSIAVASEQIATSNIDLHERTDRTASNLQQASRALSKLAENVEEGASSASAANRMAASAAEEARRGGVIAANVVATMTEINASSRTITDIVSMIEAIAFQTNILALNAAVEAACAGERGRGFSVVANEVRSLAHRASQAVSEIRLLIHTSVERIQGGTRDVAEAGRTSDSLATSVQSVSMVIDRVSSAAAQQSSGLSEVNHAISQLDEMTRQNSALVEESATAAENLRQQASVLKEAMSAFVLEADA